MLWWLLAACTRPQPIDPAVLREALEHAEQVVDGAAEADVRALVARVQTEASGELYGVDYNTVQAAAWIEERLGGVSLVPAREDQQDDGVFTRNIVAEIPGREPEWVLVTAHHDTFWASADDNASGVAVLVGVAQALAGSTPRRGIRFVAFDKEEWPGLSVGSRRYFDRHATDPITAVLNYDAVAFTNREPASQSHPTGLWLPDTADFLAGISNGPASRLLDVSMQTAAALDGPKMLGIQGVDDNRFPLTSDLHRSDHSPAWDLGIPTLFFTDTTEFRSPHYHTITDTPDTLDYAFLDEVLRHATALTWIAANEDRP